MVDFSSTYANYQNQLNQYQDRVSAYKDQLQQAKEQPIEFMRQLGMEALSPFLAHMVQSGLSSIVGDSKSGKTPTVKSEAENRTTEAEPTKVSETTPEDITSEDYLTNLKGDMVQKLRDIGENDLADAAENGQKGYVKKAYNALRNSDDPEANGIADRMDASQNARVAKFQAQNDPEPQTGEVGDIASEAAIDEVNGSDGLIARNMAELGAGTPEGYASRTMLDEPEAGQATTNVIGRLFRVFNPSQETDEAGGYVRNAINQIQSSVKDTANEAVNSLKQAVSRNVADIEQATGATANVAEDAIASGTQAIQGGTKLISNVATEATEAGTTAGETTGLATGEEIAVDSGAETGGVGFLVAGALALGGVLADIFTHHTTKPPPVAVPQISIPTFQTGLATGF
jgi:hypothetical protein